MTQRHGTKLTPDDDEFFDLVDAEFTVRDRRDRNNAQALTPVAQLELAIWADEMAMSVVPVRKVHRCTPETAIEGHPFDPVSLALDRLERFMEVGRSHAWLLEERRDLAGRRPVDLLAAGELDAVWNCIDSLTPLP